MQIPVFTNQLAVPTDPVAPRQDPAAMSEGANSAAQAAQAFGNQMIAADAKYQDAKRQSDAAAIAADAEQRLANIQFNVSTNVPVDPTTGLPDHKLAVQTFQDNAEVARDQIMRNIIDPQVQAYVAQHFDQAAIDRGIQTQQTAWGVESSARRGALDTNLASSAQQMSTAPTDLSKARISGEAIAWIKGAVAAGWLNPQEGANRQLRFGSDVAETQVQQDMNSDPAAAFAKLQDPNTYPGLLPDRRAVLVNTAQARAESVDRHNLLTEQRAEIQAERQLRQTQASNFGKMFGAAMAGNPIDPNQLADMVTKQQLSPEAANAVLSARQGQDDPNAALHLWNAVGTGEATANDIYAALSNKTISKPTGVSMIQSINSNAVGGDNANERTWFGVLKTATGGDMIEKGLVDLNNAGEVATARNYAQALVEWNNRVVIDHQDPKTVAYDMVPRYQPPDYPPVTWGRPRFGAVDSLNDVASVWNATKQAFQSGKMPEADYQQQAALLTKYRGFYADQAARQAAVKAAKGLPAKQANVEPPSVDLGGIP